MTIPNKHYVKRTQRDYTLDFKLQIVDAIEEGDMTDKKPYQFTAYKVVRPFLLG